MVEASKGSNAGPLVVIRAIAVPTATIATTATLATTATTSTITTLRPLGCRRTCHDDILIMISPRMQGKKRKQKQRQYHPYHFHHLPIAYNGSRLCRNYPSPDKMPPAAPSNYRRVVLHGHIIEVATFVRSSKNVRQLSLSVDEIITKAIATAGTATATTTKPPRKQHWIVVKCLNGIFNENGGSYPTCKLHDVVVPLPIHSLKLLMIPILRVSAMSGANREPTLYLIVPIRRQQRQQQHHHQQPWSMDDYMSLAD